MVNIEVGDCSTCRRRPAGLTHWMAIHAGAGLGEGAELGGDAAVGGGRTPPAAAGDDLQFSICACAMTCWPTLIQGRGTNDYDLTTEMLRGLL
jgi:hypothetical protein